MNWFSHWDEDLDCLDRTVFLTSKNSDDFKIPTDEEINALFATSDMSNYKEHPSISINEYKAVGRNLDLVVDKFEKATDYNTTHLMTEEEYREMSKKYVDDYFDKEWSEPKYQCSKCGGGMCKNLKTVCASLPPMYTYKCNKCGHVNYQSM